MFRVLIVDDDAAERDRLAAAASAAGYGVTTAGTGAEALALLRHRHGFDVLLIDLVMPEIDGLAVLATLHRDRHALPAIVLAANPTAATVETARRHGALDVLERPATTGRLLTSLANIRDRQLLIAAVADARSNGAGLPAGDDLAASPLMRQVLATCRRAARGVLPVLIEGEAGSGKRALAQRLHEMGDRAGRPFIRFDCRSAATPDAAATLFGDPKARTAGLFGAARRGTLLLEHVSALPDAIQQDLALRLADTGAATSSAEGRAQPRLITTSRERLLDLVAGGRFHETLYYRLAVFPLSMPPLRQRTEDLPALVARCLARFGAELGQPVAGISAEALDLLARHDWPGNVRELENTLYRAVALAAGARVEITDLPGIAAHVHGVASAREAVPDLTSASAPVHLEASSDVGNQRGRSGPQPDRFLTPGGDLKSLADVEREAIAYALDRFDGQMSQVARALGIGRSTLYRKVRECGLLEDLPMPAPQPPSRARAAAAAMRPLQQGHNRLSQN